MVFRQPWVSPGTFGEQGNSLPSPSSSQPKEFLNAPILQQPQPLQEQKPYPEAVWRGRGKEKEIGKKTVNFCSFLPSPYSLSSDVKYLCFHAENLPFLFLSSHDLNEIRPKTMVKGWVHDSGLASLRIFISLAIGIILEGWASD